MFASESEIFIKIGGILLLKFGSELSLFVSESLYRTEKQFDSLIGAVMRFSDVFFALK